MQILVPKLEEININFKIEYYQKDQKTIVTTKYGKEIFDIKDTDNKLSLNIIENFVEDIEYKQIDEDYLNQLVFTIK